jgi:hypothetical protein
VVGDPANAINDVGESSGPSLYPNPATDWINLGNISPHSKIQILDIKGTNILIEKTNFMSEEIKVDISTLGVGMYLIMVKGEETKVLKLIKK